jgi:L-ascorbate metabolism protein UlaG (beta-lactamase superfamily)
MNPEGVAAMLRHLTALFAVLCLTAAASADEKKLTIRWHGQSFFEIIASDGTRVAIDPHNIEQFGRQMVKADLAICSHLHNDHTRIDVLEKNDKRKTLYGVRLEKGKPEWTNFDEKIKGVHVRSVGTYHDNMQGLKRGLNSVTIIEMDGFKIVHLGDLGHKLSKKQLEDIGEVDILMIPVGGVYTLNGSEAKDVVEQLKPKYFILPMHRGVKGVYEDVLTADEFIDEQPNVRAGSPDELTVEVGAKKPEMPEIVLLKWVGEK